MLSDGAHLHDQGYRRCPPPAGPRVSGSPQEVRPLRTGMHHNQNCSGQVAGKPARDRLQRLDSPCGGANDDHITPVHVRPSAAARASPGGARKEHPDTLGHRSARFSRRVGRLAKAWTKTPGRTAQVAQLRQACPDAKRRSSLVTGRTRKCWSALLDPEIPTASAAVPAKERGRYVVTATLGRKTETATKHGARRALPRQNENSRFLRMTGVTSTRQAEPGPPGMNFAAIPSC